MPLTDIDRSLRTWLRVKRVAWVCAAIMRADWAAEPIAIARVIAKVVGLRHARFVSFRCKCERSTAWPSSDDLRCQHRALHLVATPVSFPRRLINEPPESPYILAELAEDDVG